MKLSAVVLSALLLLTSAVAQTPQAQSPTPTPSPLTVVRSAQTLAELQGKIRSRLFAPELRRGQVGVKIVSLRTGKVVFEDNSEKYFMPASNMKNFTVATALEKLSPDYRFVTSVYAHRLPTRPARSRVIFAFTEGAMFRFRRVSPTVIISRGSTNLPDGSRPQA